jgi:hypothetical protein
MDLKRITSGEGRVCESSAGTADAFVHRERVNGDEGDAGEGDADFFRDSFAERGVEGRPQGRTHWYVGMCPDAGLRERR